MLVSTSCAIVCDQRATSSTRMSPPISVTGSPFQAEPCSRSTMIWSMQIRPTIG
jgi:hypothetical protein